MKTLANLARILVGIEFIFSGFVKVVDPYGTGLKLQEYFEVFAADLPSFSSFFELLAHNAQTLSLLFCAGELILGVAMLFNFRMKITAWIVLLMMAFFTFLTFYSAYFNKVTDCGCFGDFLKLKPWHSFWKDIISLAVILVIFIYRNKYKEFKYGGILTALATLIAFGIGIYGKLYLPLLDFLPYAKGLSIPQQMQPTGVKPIFEYTFLDKTSNKELISSEYLGDTTKYKYLDLKTLNEDEIRPKITDYSLSDSAGNDATAYSFEGNKLLLIFKKIDQLDQNQVNEISKLATEVQKNGIEPMSITSLLATEFEPFYKKNKLAGGFYSIDEKVLKTMARTNPCLILLKDGVVVNKWSGYSIPDAESLKKLIN